MKNTQKSQKNAQKRITALKFDRSEDRLDRSIQKRADEGDYLTALRLANRRNEFFSGTADSYAAQADLYELCEANAQALKTWYRFLNICDEDSLAEAYEGLAVNYMNLSKENQSAYYYNLLLRVDDELSDESKMDIVEMFSKPKRDAFRTVYPPEKADYTEEIDRGLHALKEGDFSSARQEFAKVEERAPQYRTAQNLLAVGYLLDDKKEEAQALCEKLIAGNDEDVQAYTTYAAILGQSGRKEEALRVARKLCTVETADTDELYKIATVCCENGLHKEALEKFERLEEDIPNDRNLLYFKAVAAFQSGSLQLSVKTFERLLTIYPEAATARYYYDVLRYYAANINSQDVVAPELSYFYRVPQKVRESYCELLCFLEKLRLGEADAVADNPQVYTVLQWCFDELDGSDGDLQMFAMCVAVRCRCERFIQETLLDPDVSDAIKIRTLHLLTVRNKECEYGVVVYHIFRRVKIHRVKIGVKKHKRFLEAYAAVYAKFAIVSDIHAQRLRASAELLYNCLSLREQTALIDRTNDIACVIYILSDIKEGGVKAESAVKLFDADLENVSRVLNLVQEVTGEVLRQNRKQDVSAEE